MSYIWATRGQAWGFRFMNDGGFADPLPAYEAAFVSVGPGAHAFARCADHVALRFPDPEHRRDSSGRIIPHEFVVFSPLAEQLESAHEARRIMWSRVSATFDEVWCADTAPS